MPDTPAAVAIYCDDVRLEQSLKLVAIGIYGSDISLSLSEGDEFSLFSIVRVHGPAETHVTHIVIEHYYNEALVDKIKVNVDEKMMSSHKRDLDLFWKGCEG